MHDYLFADGPFEGQVLGTRESHATGDLMAVEVVDVDLEPEAADRAVVHDYRVEHLPALDHPGLLRHVPVPREEARLAG